MHQVLLDQLISLLLLLLSCLLSIQAILHLLGEIPQCVDYCDECLQRHYASNSDNISQYLPIDHSTGIPLLAATNIYGENPTHQSLAELEDCTHNSCTKHILREIPERYHQVRRVWSRELHPMQAKNTLRQPRGRDRRASRIGTEEKQATMCPVWQSSD
jgi:hypothetical protein